MRWFGIPRRTIVSLLCLLSFGVLAFADPMINNSYSPKKDTNIKRLWNLFGFGGTAETRPSTLNGISPQPPCYQFSTTTPTPRGPIPMCPLQPMPKQTPPLLPPIPQPPSYPQLPPAPPPPSYPQLPPAPPPPSYPQLPSVPPPPSYPQFPPAPPPPSYPQFPPVPPPPSYPQFPPAPPPPSYPQFPPAPPPPSYPQLPPAPPPPTYPQLPPAPPPPTYPQIPPAPLPPAYPQLPPAPPPPTYPQIPNPPPFPSQAPPTFSTGQPPNPKPGLDTWITAEKEYWGHGGGGQFVGGGYKHIIPGENALMFPPNPTRPYPTPGLTPEPSNPVPTVGFCAGVPIGPIVPPSFFLANNQLQQQQCRDKCRPQPMDVPLCGMMEVLQQLRLRTVSTLIQQAGLEQLFSQTAKYTLFAPVDAAFEKLPAWFMQSLRDDIKLLRAFILNHFVKDTVSLSMIGNEFRVMNARAGGHRLRINVYHQESDYRVYTVDGARIILGEIKTSNEGVLHVLDKVLIPNPPRLAGDYLAELPAFKTFLTAVLESGLMPYLQDKDNPVTILIPHNPAFNSFNYKAIAGNVAAVRNFVNYHIINGTHYSSGLLHGQYLITNYYKEIKLGVSTDGFTKYMDTIDARVKVLKADIPCLNGVVHIVDSCLTHNQEFLFDAELNEFSMDFGTFKRSMTLNKKELEMEMSMVSHTEHPNEEV